MIDVEGMIRQASTRVSVDQLLKKGKKFIHVLSREKIDELINRSVKTIVDKHRVTAAYRQATSAAQIEAEARAEFEELLQQYKQTTDAKSAVECSRQALVQDLEEIRFELDSPSLDVPAGPPDAVEAFARELDKQVVRVFQIRKTILQRTDSPESVAELGRLEEILRPRLAAFFAVERDRFTASVGDPRELSMLKKRMEKLTAYIATLEAALQTLSTAKTFTNQQVQNLLRELGLAPQDKNFEKKKEMLKVVLSATQGIRKKARELAARGITLDAPEEQAVFSPVPDCLTEVFSRSSS